METETAFSEVENKEDLLLALKRKDDFILIRHTYLKEFLDDQELPMPETDKMGVQIGYMGFGDIYSELFYYVINKFGKGTNIQKEIDRRARRYTIKNGARTRPCYTFPN